MANNRNRGGPPNHRIGPDRDAWVRVHRGELILYVGKPDTEGPDDDLDSVRVTINFGRSVTVDLSNLTRHELDAMRAIFDRAFEKAGPVVDELDRRAAAAWEAGDDSYARQYRAVPQLVVRQRGEQEHDPGVQG